jgi:predicted DNA binding CopG/RHH family protein
MAKPKSAPKPSQFLDKEEQDLVQSFEAGEWTSASSATKKRIQGIFGLGTRKDTRVNIRLSGQDLTALQMRAAREGLPYQTLLASLVHKYVTGQLQPVS